MKKKPPESKKVKVEKLNFDDEEWSSRTKRREKRKARKGRKRGRQKVPRVKIEDDLVKQYAAAYQEDCRANSTMDHSLVALNYQTELV